MSVVDLFQNLFNHLTMSSHVPKPKDKIKVMLLLLIQVLRSPIPKRVLNIPASVEKRMLSMVDSLSKIDCGGIINVNGINYALRDYGSLMIISPNFESWMWKYLKPQEGEKFVDVGAHIGKYALQVARIIGEEGSVIAVEADPENFKVLRKNVDANDLKNVRALNLTAWNETRKLKLYRATNSGGGSVKHDMGIGYIEVEATPLDNVLGGMKVDWIKIDVEGAELETLGGLKQTLEKYHPNVIVEVSKRNVKKVVSFMRKRDYTAKIIHKGANIDYFLFSAVLGGNRR